MLIIVPLKLSILLIFKLMILKRMIDLPCTRSTRQQNRRIFDTPSEKLRTTVGAMLAKQPAFVHHY